MTNLVPGVDLLSERFRCDGRTLVAALRFVMDELARGRHNLFVSDIFPYILMISKTIEELLSY